MRLLYTKKLFKMVTISLQKERKDPCMWYLCFFHCALLTLLAIWGYTHTSIIHRQGVRMHMTPWDKYGLYSWISFLSSNMQYFFQLKKHGCIMEQNVKVISIFRIKWRFPRNLRNLWDKNPFLSTIRNTSRKHRVSISNKF